jgi:segregation and condensation protein A
MLADVDDDQPSAPAVDPLWDDWDTPPRVPAIPELHLAGFNGPLDLLLDLAERERIDLSRISVTDMVDQFVAAMVRFESHMPLERRADWLNLVARLLLLRSRLFLPKSPAAQKAALDEAERERGRLQNLQFLRAATAWLDARPQLGRDVFARPRRERDPRVASYMRLMEACLAVLEVEEAREQPALEQVYTPRVHVLFRIPDALVRMRATLAELGAPMKLTGFLPRMPEVVAERELVARSAVASTFFATLELARTAELALGEGELFEVVTCTSPTISRDRRSEGLSSVPRAVTDPK